MKPWTIEVKNKKTFKGDGGWYVGRPTALGNPFEIGKDGNRREVIEKYRQWLSDGMSGDNPCMRAFMNLYDEVARTGELVLVCWCAPQECHADVIKDFLMETWDQLNEESQ